MDMVKKKKNYKSPFEIDVSEIYLTSEKMT